MKLMRIDALWKRWIEILAGLVIAVQEAWRARRARGATSYRGGSRALGGTGELLPGYRVATDSL